MIAQGRIAVKVADTDVAVTGLAGLPVLVNLAHETGLMDDLDGLLPAKERARGYAVSAAALDLMAIPWTGGACIDDLAVLRADCGLARLLGRAVLAPSTAHDFLRRMSYVGLEGLGAVRRRQLAHLAQRTGQTRATLDCDASLFVSRNRPAKRSALSGNSGWSPLGRTVRNSSCSSIIATASQASRRKGRQFSQ